jgi:hypothetical protein
MKKMTLAILALVLVTVTTAFAWQRNDGAAKKDVTDYAYFRYTPELPGGENNELNWEKVSETSSVCLDDEGFPCTIKAPIANSQDMHPDFTGITDVSTDQRILERTFRQE